MAREVTSGAFRKWACNFCGEVYDEELGMPDEGITPRTRWEDVPEGWCCPHCGAEKSGFALIE